MSQLPPFFMAVIRKIVQWVYYANDYGWGFTNDALLECGHRRSGLIDTREMLSVECLVCSNDGK